MPKYRETVDVDGLPRPGTPPPRPEPPKGSLRSVTLATSKVHVTISKIEVEADNPDMFASELSEAFKDDDDDPDKFVADITEASEIPQFDTSYVSSDNGTIAVTKATPQPIVVAEQVSDAVEEAAGDMESSAEHIARDIKDGTFPNKSKRKPRRKKKD